MFKGLKGKVGYFFTGLLLANWVKALLPSNGRTETISCVYLSENERATLYTILHPHVLIKVHASPLAISLSLPTPFN